MNAISEFLVATIMVMLSGTATAAPVTDDEWLNNWVAEDYHWGGLGIVYSEKFDNSGLLLIASAHYDCSMQIAPTQSNADARDVIDTLGITSDHELFAQDSVVKVRVDGGDIYTWRDVDTKAFTTDESTFINYSPVDLTHTEGLFAEMLGGTSMIIVLDDDQTDYISLIGFSKVASEALELCEEKLNNVAVNEWGA